MPSTCVNTSSKYSQWTYQKKKQSNLNTGKAKENFLTQIYIDTGTGNERKITNWQKYNRKEHNKYRKQTSIAVDRKNDSAKYFLCQVIFIAPHRIYRQIKRKYTHYNNSNNNDNYQEHSSERRAKINRFEEGYNETIHIVSRFSPLRPGSQKTISLFSQ